MPDLTKEQLQSDWRISLMISIKDWISENPSLFLPIVTTWSQDEREDLNVPMLRDVLKLKNKEKLPILLLYHPTSKKAIVYPEPLDDMDKVSPELVMIWAKHEVMMKEIELLEQRLKEYSDETMPAETKLTAEQIPKVEAHLAQMRPVLVDLENAKKEIKEQIKTSNKFADYARS